MLFSHTVRSCDRLSVYAISVLFVLGACLDCRTLTWPVLCNMFATLGKRVDLLCA